MNRGVIVFAPTSVAALSIWLRGEAPRECQPIRRGIVVIRPAAIELDGGTRPHRLTGASNRNGRGVLVDGRTQRSLENLSREPAANEVPQVGSGGSTVAGDGL